MNAIISILNKKSSHYRTLISSQKPNRCYHIFLIKANYRLPIEFKVLNKNRIFKQKKKPDQFGPVFLSSSLLLGSRTAQSRPKPSIWKKTSENQLHIKIVKIFTKTREKALTFFNPALLWRSTSIGPSKDGLRHTILPPSLIRRVPTLGLPIPNLKQKKKTLNQRNPTPTSHHQSQAEKENPR